jgi:CRP-like cAMP-binding protein
MLLSRNAFLKTVQDEPKIAIALLQTMAERLRASERSASH